MDEKKLEALRRARAAQSDDARPDAVKVVRASNHLTARERIDLLLDRGSAVEYGAIAAKVRDSDEWVAEAGGVDFFGTVNGLPIVTSSTDYTDHGGGYGANRITHLMALAQEQRWPAVFFVDGGGSRARHPRAGLGHIEIEGPIGRFGLFDGMAELSGWVPTIAIVSGPSFAGHASLAGFSDCVIATRGSSIGMGGPPMVEAALGLRISAPELAGVEMHEERGGIDLLVDDEPAAIQAAKRYLSYYRDLESGEPAAGAGRIAEFVADEGPYDIRPVLDALVDRDSLFELRLKFGPSVIAAFARIEGRSVGILASQPLVDGGAIDEAAATKIARFVEICDAYEYPIVALIDTPGFVSRWGEEEAAEPGMRRAHARTLMAHHHRSVPLFSVQIRRAGGLGAFAMSGYGNGASVPAMRLAWPGVELGERDGFAASAHVNAFDDAIDPAETRERIARVLRHTRRRFPDAEKKHAIDTW